MTLTEEDRWEILIQDIRRASLIIGMPITEAVMPDYMNWIVARDLHLKLWARIYFDNKKAVISAG